MQEKINIPEENSLDSLEGVEKSNKFGVISLEQAELRKDKLLDELRKMRPDLGRQRDDYGIPRPSVENYIKSREEKISTLNPNIPEELEMIRSIQERVDSARQGQREQKEREIEEAKYFQQLKDHFSETNFVEEAIKEQNKHREERRSFTEPSSSFHEIFKTDIPETRFIRDFIKDKPLINLGAGIDTFVARSFRNYGVEKYTGVDILNPAYHEVDKDGQVKGEAEGTYFVQEDMLRYISKLPDNFGNVNLNGIDTSIVTSGKYGFLLALHLFRIVPSGGVVFGYGSEAIFGKLEKVGFVHLLSKKEGFDVDVFYKK